MEENKEQIQSDVSVQSNPIQNERTEAHDQIKDSHKSEEPAFESSKEEEIHASEQEEIADQEKANSESEGNDDSEKGSSAKEKEEGIIRDAVSLSEKGNYSCSYTPPYYVPGFIEQETKNEKKN